MRTIMVSNNKGGVGKSSVTMELCSLFARNGKKVLAIDMDGQRNLSMYSRVQLKKSEDGQNIADIRMVLSSIKKLSEGNEDSEDDDILERAIQHSPEGYDIIVAAKELSDAQVDFGKPEDIYLLQDLFSVLDEYDYIFIDCAPARSPLLYMAYRACDYCLIITESDAGSIEGVRQIATDIRLLHQRNLANIKIIGTLLNKNEDTSEQNNAYIKLCNIGQEINAMPFETTIYKGIAVTEAHNKSLSIYSYMQQGDRSIKKKTKQLIDSFTELGKELEERISIVEGV